MGRMGPVDVKALLFKITAVVLSVSFFLLGLEMFVRAFNLAQPRIGQQDPVFGTSYIPDQTAVNEFGVKIEIGRHGFRGPTPALEKPAGVFRIVLLGDSFLHARAIPYDQVFHALLHQRFQATGRPIEPINMGVEGYCTVEEYLVYHHLAKRYQPDLVILFFYVGNDLNDNYPPRPNRPGFRLVDGQLEYVPFEVKGHRRNLVRDFCRKHIRIYTYLPDLVRNAANIWSARLSDETQRRRFEEQHLQFEQGADVGTTRMVLKEDPLGENWRLTLALLQRLHQEVSADGGRLALCILPTVTQIYDSYWELLRQTYKDFDTSGWDRFKPQKILERFSQEERIIYIPFSRIMAERVQETGEMYFLPGDYHLNAPGHALLAEVLEPVLNDLFEKNRPVQARNPLPLPKPGRAK